LEKYQKEVSRLQTEVSVLKSKLQHEKVAKQQLENADLRRQHQQHQVQGSNCTW
jgi:hypothetical protein